MLVEKQLAACVNMLAPCRSVYRWKGAVQQEEEHPMLIKTTAERYAELEQALRAGHPYELPEIVAVPIERGLPAYLAMGRRRNQAVNRLLLFFLALILSAPALGQLPLGGSADDLLEPEKAFRFSARAVDGSTIEVRFRIADGYYMYRERFQFAAEGNPSVRLKAPQLPPGQQAQGRVLRRGGNLPQGGRVSASPWRAPGASTSR